MSKADGPKERGPKKKPVPREAPRSKGGQAKGATPKKAPAAPEAAEAAEVVVLPPWMAREMDGHSASGTLRGAAEGFVAPLYEDLVLNAEDPLERSAGEMLAFLMWVGLVQKDRLAQESLSIQGTRQYRNWEKFDDILAKILKVTKEEEKLIALVDRLRSSGERRRRAAADAAAQDRSGEERRASEEE